MSVEDKRRHNAMFIGGDFGAPPHTAPNKSARGGDNLGEFKPQVHTLAGEVAERSKLLTGTAKMCKSWKAHQSIKWLEENPRTPEHPPCATRAIQMGKPAPASDSPTRQAAAARRSSSAGSGGDDDEGAPAQGGASEASRTAATPKRRWNAHAACRLAHVIVELKVKFLTRDYQWDKAKKDDKALQRSEDFWKAAASKFDDAEFQPKNPYTNSTVQGLDLVETLDPEMAWMPANVDATYLSAKFTDLRGELDLIFKNHGRSGNGDGCGNRIDGRAVDDNPFEEDDDPEPEVEQADGDSEEGGSAVAAVDRTTDSADLHQFCRQSPWAWYWYLLFKDNGVPLRSVTSKFTNDAATADGAGGRSTTSTKRPRELFKGDAPSAPAEVTIKRSKEEVEETKAATAAHNAAALATKAAYVDTIHKRINSLQAKIDSEGGPSLASKFSVRALLAAYNELGALEGHEYARECAAELETELATA